MLSETCTYVSSTTLAVGGCLVIATSALAYWCYKTFVDTKVYTETASTSTTTASVAVENVSTQTDIIPQELQALEISNAASQLEAVQLANQIVNPVDYRSVYHLLMDQVEKQINYLIEDYALHNLPQLEAFYRQYGGMNVFYSDLSKSIGPVMNPDMFSMIFGKIVTNTISEEGTLLAFQGALSGHVTHFFNVSIIQTLSNRGMSPHEIGSLLKELKISQKALDDITLILTDLICNS